jgi:hypothetical protein
MSDEKDVIREDDENTRLKYQACPGCSADLGAAIHDLEKCPYCGEEL